MKRINNAINDDLNMPLAMGIVWEVIRNEKKSKQYADLLLDFDQVLGLKIDQATKKEEQKIPQEIMELIEERKEARQNKDWAKSDRLRDIINEKGYDIKDTKDGMEVKKR